MTTHEQRARCATLMDILVRHAPAVHYAQVRPMRTRTIADLPHLVAALRAPAGVTMDCSESVTLICRLAGMRDPNGLKYDGAGYTGTLLRYLMHYTDPRSADIAAIVVFGNGSGEHACMVREPGSNPLLFSHGSEAGPFYTRLSEERRYHTGAVTFCSVAHL